LPHIVKPEDSALFQACTTIHNGNGEKSLFWKDAWLNGVPLADSFPDLFSLNSRKNHTIKMVLGNDKWMKGLQRLTTSQQLDNFVALWTIG
jgi:hypothetical protein